MAITDEDRLEYSIFQGEEGDIRLHTKNMRTAAKEHPCFGGLGSNGDGHTIKPGDRYRHERALIDGDFWGNYRMCLACCDKGLDELKGDTDEDDDE